MDVRFKNKKEEAFFTSQKALRGKFGARTAQKIIQRISQLEAAETPQQLPQSARFHEHQGSRKGLFSVDLDHPRRLIVSPTTPYRSWVEIKGVEIYEVMDPH